MKLYLEYLKIHFKSELSHKASFILSFFSQFIVFFGYYFTILCLFDRFSNIKGFTVYEVLFTFGIIQFGCSFCETFFRGVDRFDNLILDGSFDRLLLRPRNILLQVFGNEISFIKASRLIQSIIVIIISIINIEVNWDLCKIVTFLCMLIGSILVFLEIFIVSASYCFLTLKGLEIRNVFTDGGKHMAQYPINIYKKGFALFFTFIIPYGFVNYYPLLYLLGKTDKQIFIFSPLITFLYLIPCIWIFKKGVKRYGSTGS